MQDQGAQGPEEALTLAMANFRYQWARLLYQHRKLPHLKQGMSSPWGGNIEFELFTFFEICHHLKDWLRRTEQGYPRDDEQRMEAPPGPLSICAALANRQKHGGASNHGRKRSGAPERPEVGPIMCERVITIGPYPVARRIVPSMSNSTVKIPTATVQTPWGERCCFELADQCVEAWADYLLSRGIATERPPTPRRPVEA